MKILSLGALAVGATLLIAQPSTPAEPVDKDPKAAAAAVTQALRGTKEINSKNVSVTTHAGTVLLSGTVKTEPEAARALTVAEKAAEGLRVSSSLEVEAPAAGGAAPELVKLVHAVEAALSQDPRTAKLTVTVSIDEHKSIALHGLVPSRQDRATAQTVALQVKGVTQVDNRLVTAQQ